MLAAEALAPVQVILCVTAFPVGKEFHYIAVQYRLPCGEEPFPWYVHDPAIATEFGLLVSKNMAKKSTGKKKKTSYRGPQQENPSSRAGSSEATGGGMYAVRETIESIVIAFVLAFLFRTFEAEAFVIPTGSMSPSLQGQHKDVHCSECGYRFRGTASSEGEDRQQFLAMLRDPGLSLASREMLQRKVLATEVVSVVCPMCRQTMAMRPDIPSGAPPYIDTTDIETQTSYPGDRILVNKYSYTHNEPERWDVVVFKFPGNGEMNYIKRLVGLPNETLKIYQGDIFVRDDDPENATVDEGFPIERKPSDKVRAMLQPVHDSDYEASILFNAGWPLRWQADGDSRQGEAWQVDANPGEQTVALKYRFDSSADESPAWLRYHHFVPQNQDWIVARRFAETGEYSGFTKQEWLGEARPQLVRDFNSYNTSLLRGGSGDSRIPPGVLDRGWEMSEDKFGMHWVGDLAVDCHVEVEKAAGQLYLDLVEAGEHFTCRIDLETGEATVGVKGSDKFSATAKTSVSSPGNYEILLANVDDQLLLWIDGELIPLSKDSAGLHYDADEVFGGRKNAIPQTSEDDPGDLAPVGIGAQGATLAVNRLQVLRDIYYVATKRRTQIMDYPNSDITLADGTTLPPPESLRQLFTDPEAWPRFSKRREVRFATEEEQLFVMGDNSPASQDCRLWSAPNRDGSKPGGPYLDRRLLIGKAVCVFWPHSWGSIPGLNKLPGLPNFKDMRLVR